MERLTARETFLDQKITALLDFLQGENVLPLLISAFRDFRPAHDLSLRRLVVLSNNHSKLLKTDNTGLAYDALEPGSTQNQMGSILYSPRWYQVIRNKIEDQQSIQLHGLGIRFYALDWIRSLGSNPRQAIDYWAQMSDTGMKLRLDLENQSSSENRSVVPSVEFDNAEELIRFLSSHSTYFLSNT